MSKTYGLARLQLKLTHACALVVHACFMMFPLLLPFAIVPLFKRRDRDTNFLLAWIGIFCAAAVILFFAGSARYLLPIAAPMALLVSRLPVKYLRIAIPAQLVFSLLLATVNYQHWSGYREFARSLSKETKSRRTWANAEWGLRWYLVADGARPVHDEQHIPAGDMVVSSELAFPTPYNRGGSSLVEIAAREIRPAIPLRLIGLDSHSGYSTADKGLLPFGISSGPIDRVRAVVLVEHHPTLEYLPMSAPEADDQIISGVYGREGTNPWRWTAGSATLALKKPAQPKPLHLEVYIPDASPVRTVRVLGDGRELYAHTFDKPGNYTLDTAPSQSGNITIQFDKTFSVPGDHRELGVILTGIGYRQ